MILTRDQFMQDAASAVSLGNPRVFARLADHDRAMRELVTDLLDVLTQALPLSVLVDSDGTVDEAAYDDWHDRAKAAANTAIDQRGVGEKDV